jgi:ComEC/Rec2-related protein
VTERSRYEHITARPLVATLPFFIAGLLARDYPLMLLLVPPAALIARRWWLLGAFLLLLGFARGSIQQGPAPPLRPGTYTVEGEVAGTPVLGASYQQYILFLPDRNLLVFDQPQRTITAGDWLRVTGRLSGIEGPSRTYWQRRNITQRISAQRNATEVLQAGIGPAAWGSAWRDDMWSRLKANLPFRPAAIAMGVVGGQQSLVPREVVENMQRAGTLHLLATSGYNILLLAGALMLVFSHLPVSRSIQILGTLVLLVAYAGAVGGRAPVVRATLVATFYLGLFLFRRIPDALSATAAAAITYLLMEPWSVHDAGFQLSFVTVFGLAFFVPALYFWSEKRYVERMQRAWQRLVWRVGFSLVAATVVAQVASGPLTAYHFGYFSVAAPISNLLTALAVPLVYLGAGLAQLVDLVWPTGAAGIDICVTGPAAGWIDASNAFFGSQSWSAISVSPGVAALLFYYAALLAVTPSTRRHLTAEDS